MSIEWYRAYHGMPYDPKLQVVARRSEQIMATVVVVWVCILDAASRHDPRGIGKIDPEEIAVIQGLQVEAVEAVLQAMLDKGLIDEEGFLTSWPKRQHTTSTERSQKSRSRKKKPSSSDAPRKRKSSSCNGMQRDATDGNSLQQDATPCDAVQLIPSEKDTDTESDTEADKITDLETEQESDSEKKTEREEKGESEREKRKSRNSKVRKDAKAKQICQQMLEIWNAEVQSQITPDRKSILTAERQNLMIQRWNEEFDQQIQAWKYYCLTIANSDFCMGSKGWTIDLTWAVKSPDHVIKVLEGGFSGGKMPPKLPQCDIPEFQEIWDQVLASFEKHHGKALCHIWLGNTILSAAEAESAILECPTKFHRQWLAEKYLDDLNFMIAKASGDTVKNLQLIVGGVS